MCCFEEMAVYEARDERKCNTTFSYSYNKYEYNNMLQYHNNYGSNVTDNNNNNAALVILLSYEACVCEIE